MDTPGIFGKIWDNRHSVAFYSVCCLICIYLFAWVEIWTRAAQVVDQSITPAEISTVQDGGSCVFLDNDAYYWLSYARQMMEEKTWRIRFTHIDNAPFGRPVHWSQSISWLLVGAGWLRHAFTSESLFQSMEAAAVWVNPCLLLAFVLGWSRVLYKFLGTGAAILFMLLMTTLGDIGWAFQPLRPDHQSLQVVFTISSVMCLILGGGGLVRTQSKQEDTRGRWFYAIQSPTLVTARRFFIASGFFGGLGLWVGATVVLFGMLAVGCACMLLTYFLPPVTAIEREGLAYQSRLWRYFGWAGALTSLAFYLLEYAPDYGSLHLEVNHPVYSFGWLCLGELLAHFTAWKLRGARLPLWRLSLFLLLAIGATLPALLIFFGPMTLHGLRDPLMQRLHRFILEFYSFSAYTQGRPVQMLFRSMGLLPLMLLSALYYALPHRSRLSEWMSLWLGFSLCFFYLAIAYQQVRWISLYAAINVVLAVWVLVVAARFVRDNHVTAGSHWGFRLLMAGLLVQSVFFGFSELGRGLLSLRLQMVRTEFVKAVLMKRLATQLGNENSAGRFRFMTDPELAAPLYYFGRIPSLASFYWENADGLEAESRFLTDTPVGEQARRIASDRTITHVMVPQGLDLATMFYFIQKGTVDAAGMRRTLVDALLTRRETLPGWLAPDAQLTSMSRMNYVMTGAGGKRQSLNTQMMVFQVRSDKAREP